MLNSCPAYWLGNRKVGITQVDNGFAATLSNLHKGTGMSVCWILGRHPRGEHHFPQRQRGRALDAYEFAAVFQA